MKKILITGAGSYIGTSFEKYINDNCPGDYAVDTIDMIDGTWREASFAGYDCVFHVAGLAHIKETSENSHLYFEVNRDLAVATAEKAKADGVGQFVFLSSMSVYGLDAGVITKSTKPSPVSSYGRSKLEAEQALAELASESFRIATLRPPMVYGKNCRGNFQLMASLVRKSPVFPAISNRRSMISVTNLCAFVHMVIERELDGLYMPQNKEYVNTTDMARLIADALGKKTFFSRLCGLAVRMLIPFVSKARKAFASLTYEDCEDFGWCYCIEDFEESVKNSINAK